MSHLIPGGLNLYSPITSALKNVSRFVTLYEKNYHNDRYLRYLMSELYEAINCNKLKELFSNLFYEKPFETYVGNSLNINLDERFNLIYQHFIGLHKIDKDYQINIINLLLRYEQENGLVYFHKNYDHKNPFFSNDVLEKIDKYEVILHGFTPEKQISRNKEIHSYFTTIYDKLDKLYNPKDKLEKVIIDLGDDNSLVFSIDNFKHWKNKNILFNQEHESNLELLLKLIEKDIDNFYSDVVDMEYYAEYFSYLQHFINVQFLHFSDKNNIDVVNKFIKSIKRYEFPVVLDGKLREIYIKYHHMMETKINTLENIDELNRFYENIFVSETSLLPAPTSVIEYMKSIGKVSYDKRNTKLIDYLTINKIKPEITGLALKEHNYKYMDEPFKRILFQEHILNSYPDIQFELENEQIIDLIKFKTPFKNIVLPDNFIKNVNESLKSGYFNKEDYEYYLSFINGSQNKNKTIKVI